MAVEQLASYQRVVARIGSQWPAFLAKRQDRLQEQVRRGRAAERVAENIVEDVFTGVLDWSLADVNHQVGYADLLLTRLGVKYLIVETKYPGALAWNAHAVEAALDQARQYADEQRVRCVAVSDGVMLYAADVEHGVLRDRVFVPLDSHEAPESLWWLSVHGIYRSCEDVGAAARRLLPERPPAPEIPVAAVDGVLLHPKYKLPAHCFGYVGDAGKPATWKLPFCCMNGEPDHNRLPKAIQAILSNYRGTKVAGIPEQAIPDVLIRLARAAHQSGKLPHQTPDTAPVYVQLAQVLEQIGRLEELIK